MQYSLSINDCLSIGSVQINVLEVWHDRVRLGINDPDASPTYREEVLYTRSGDHDNDDDGDADFMYDEFNAEDLSPFAVHAV